MNLLAYGVATIATRYDVPSTSRFDCIGDFTGGEEPLSSKRSTSEIDVTDRGRVAREFTSGSRSTLCLAGLRRTLLVYSEPSR